MTETQTGDRLQGTLPAILQTAVLGESSEMPAGLVPVKGHDFNEGVYLNGRIMNPPYGNPVPENDAAIW